MNEKMEFLFTILLSIIIMLLLHLTYEEIPESTSIKVSNLKAAKNNKVDSEIAP